MKIFGQVVGILDLISRQVIQMKRHLFLFFARRCREYDVFDCVCIRAYVYLSAVLAKYLKPVDECLRKCYELLTDDYQDL